MLIIGSSVKFVVRHFIARKCMHEKLYQLPEHYTMFARNNIFPKFFEGGGATALPAPASYDANNILYKAF